jgi:hypothetical protein
VVAIAKEVLGMTRRAEARSSEAAPQC